MLEKFLRNSFWERGLESLRFHQPTPKPPALIATCNMFPPKVRAGNDKRASVGPSRVV